MYLFVLKLRNILNESLNLSDIIRILDKPSIIDSLSTIIRTYYYILEFHNHVSQTPLFRRPTVIELSYAAVTAMCR